MPSSNLFKKLFFIIGLNFFLLTSGGLVQGETPGDISWQNLETKHTIVHYQTMKDLKKFNGKVAYVPGPWSFKRLFSAPGSDGLKDRLKKKVDALFERVQEILDMRKKMKKVTIEIYPNKGQLYDAYFRIYKTHGRLRAWYIYEYNTIYTNVDDLHEGMLAHELAHSIIDHYLLVRPPKATAEILARYVDKHLFD